MPRLTRTLLFAQVPSARHSHEARLHPTLKRKQTQRESQEIAEGWSDKENTRNSLVARGCPPALWVPNATTQQLQLKSQDMDVL
ncbi:hypothetical protein NDU88_004632 [Pleurodeles waltl]|uniref:Secreted protein n=1 Tax=Pleurodeles waltl TaxID=8319 RepID=A0AAV7UFX3_PLEWA|nr:hypothetical protein NDU88_004632 [Pleurodeles waltl]